MSIARFTFGDSVNFTTDDYMSTETYITMQLHKRYRKLIAGYDEYYSEKKPILQLTRWNCFRLGWINMYSLVMSRLIYEYRLSLKSSGREREREEEKRNTKGILDSSVAEGSFAIKSPWSFDNSSAAGYRKCSLRLARSYSRASHRACDKARCRARSPRRIACNFQRSGGK